MEIFKSLPKFFKKSAPEPENYLSLTIGPDRVTAHIWTFEGSLVKTLGFGKKSFKNTDVLVHQTAVAIDTAGEEAKVDVSKTVFGLTQNWMREGKLEDITIKTLKKISDELDLEAQAYVSLAASINHFLKIEDKITPQFVAIGIFGDETNPSFCEVHLIEKNQVTASRSSQSPINLEKIQNLTAELKENEADLPSRIIIYGISQDSPFGQKIATYHWQDIFIHEPKIDFIDDRELALAVSYAQAADLLGHEPIVKIEETKKEQKGEQHHPDELGFVEGENILATPREETESNIVEKPKLQVESEGMPKTQNAESQQEYAVEVASVEKPKIIHKTQNALSDDSQLQQESKGGFLSTLFSLLSFSRPYKKLAIVCAVVVIVATVAAYIAAQTVIDAQVRIIVAAKPFEDTFSAQVLVGSTTDSAKSQIGGQTITAKADGSQKAVTTGSKKVGDPARGEVTVFNWTTTPKKFAGHEGLISANGVKFTLDSEIEIASRSASTPGEINAQVTAADVGPVGNIPAATDFTFQQFDELSYSAINITSFTGGTERQVTVVTQEDLTKLEKSLTETLTQKAKEDLKSKAADNSIVDDALNIKITKKVFDQEIDSEAPLINLNMEVEATSLVFDQNELKKLLAEISKEKFAEGFEARAENIEVKDISVKKQENKLNLSGKFEAQLVPKFDENEMKSKIAGKSVKETRSIIKENQGVADVIVDFSPNIPILSSIPKNKDKIKFKFEIS